MEKRTSEQNSILHGLLTELGAIDQKENLAYQFSKGRTSFTSELSACECEELINCLRTQVKTQKDLKQEKLHKARWRLRYALMNHWGFSIMIRGQEKPDFARINAYSSKYWHKLIDDMSYEELLAKEASVIKNTKTTKAE